MNTLIDILQVTVPVLLLVLLNGYFVAAEFALVRSLGTTLRSPELKNRFGTRPAIRLLESLDQSISTTQLGITVASLVLGWYGEEKFHNLILGALDYWGVNLSIITTHSLSTMSALALVTFLHVVMGELVAKRPCDSIPRNDAKARRSYPSGHPKDFSTVRCGHESQRKFRSPSFWCIHGIGG